MKFQKVMSIDKGWEIGFDSSAPSPHITRPIPRHIVELRARLKFYSAKELADFLGLSIWSIYEWTKDGKLQAQRMGRILKVSSYDLADFLEEQNK